MDEELWAVRRKILETPEDDAPRLIYADALQERDKTGDNNLPNFIRVQVRLAELRAKETKLLRDMEIAQMGVTKNGEVSKMNGQALDLKQEIEDWDGKRHEMRGGRMTVGQVEDLQILGYSPYTTRPHVWTDKADFHDWLTFTERVSPLNPHTLLDTNRGFIAWVKCDWDWWKEHGPRLVRWHPIEYVRVSNKRPEHMQVSTINNRNERSVDVYSWLEEHPLDESDENEYVIHLLVASHLDQSKRQANLRWFQYDTERGAYDDLSQALIRWAKATPE